MAYLEYTPNSTLFHYCSTAGFDGITRSGSIWLTDLRYANDPKELELAKVIETVILELMHETTTSGQIHHAYKAIIPILQRQRSHFGFNSFSLSLQGDKLPMWQEYTDRGRGFCIAFRPSTFNDMPLRIQRVRYVSPEYYGSIHSQVEAIIRQLVGHERDQIRQILTATELLQLVTAVKNDTWQHEDEIRLVFSCSVRPEDFSSATMLPIGKLPDGTPVFPEDPLYRERLGQKVPYHVKPFGRFRHGKWDSSGAIERVLVGPNNPMSLDDVRRHLAVLGYKNFQVVKSRCAFR